MQKIVPHLWYDKEAKEAESINFELAGQQFAV
ncbi:VOC family protein [Clostridium estertheticum]|nr:VOC family protein [Clostridium estertheticum]MCB2358703.1 VOC family protein [Clostridium estertheticum]